MSLSKKNNKLLFGLLIFLFVNLLIIGITLGVRMGHNGESFSTALVFLVRVVYLDNYLRQNPLLLGSLVLVGYLVLGRGGRDAFLGALKTAIGVFLLGIGASILVGLAAPVFRAIGDIKSGGVVPLDPYLGWTSAENFLQTSFGKANNFLTLASFTFIAAFIVNILMVLAKRFTNTNSIVITGHIMLQQSTIVTALLYVILFRSIPLLDDGAISTGSQVGLVLISGLFLGIYWATSSVATLKITNLVTQNAGFAVGHQQMLTLFTSYKMGRFFGNKEHSAENRKLPESLKIFEDNIFTQTIIMLFLFAILFAIIIGYHGLESTINSTYSGFTGAAEKIGATWNGSYSGANFVLIIFGGVLRMIAALIAIMTGVRMFVTELQQSFHGISEKVIPGAVVAVDIAATYGFSINAVTYGFLGGVFGQFLAVFITVGLAAIPGNNYSLVAIPLFITLFFNSGAMGVYANASGGWKAAFIVPAIIGFFEIIVISFGLKLVQNIVDVGIPVLQDNAGNPVLQNPVTTGFLGMGDWNLFFGLSLIIGQFHYVLGWITVFVGMIGLILLAQGVDSTKQTKKTWLQKLLKVNVDLVQKEA
ncbi:PTS ascorbate transporter subunit IIC [Mesomycoplasma ovipneumoniae]|uniref:Ascorbate-specific PTS system EIIC component n=1 Tax=Mesomycoplasma ovipneumoniae TaxID=29562 RepID=A0AAW6Q8L3_9BACT|nr:PTS ascorbate transporter subunit IIC [Mesomycoplasma ovipneumoniae]MDF9627719.1 PTS ascorbate transporter subunit IIC [Mesomycoplasma ovipneumoniae]MDO4157808.1 PTS ascorbate transporter subunit IIC [Mesomycoplasma ovipneumoniae]MDO4158735.1 PTS ascorbate transporter subunit IIC [Mesomycoplasma ovipneumoniae]MDO6821914.1 PTS ascorbate transporter subunit IIC [Mesomycoplasma ovipneumoniae]MDO6855909.1 PTS ascorbate transporter subunit IIC [Mesomycoplasma ovipneumoniae]